MIVWIVDFLSSRTQQVRVETWLSHKQSTLPDPFQGCVLSPLLLLHKHFPQHFSPQHFIKYADDAALVSLLRGGEEVHGPVHNGPENDVRGQILSLTPQRRRRCQLILEIKTHLSSLLVTES